MAHAAHERSRFTCQQCFEEAEFLVALQIDAKRFSKAEIETGVSEVLLEVLDHMWEAARVAGFPLPCLEDEDFMTTMKTFNIAERCFPS